jgi:protein-S-isoprenylcysteine O-methyltransferase Ste14
VSAGPYKYIRHPGYLGIILAVTGIPFILGSAYGFIATGFCILIMIIRTYLEDNVLKEKLSGYKEYSNRVKYRLCYGIF